MAPRREAQSLSQRILRHFPRRFFPSYDIKSPDELPTDPGVRRQAIIGEIGIIIMRVNRAAVLTRFRSLTVASQPLPEVGASSVCVRLEGCGVCGSNLPVWEGRPWFNYPLAAGAPGYEGWGVIDAVGDDVESVKEGAAVEAVASGQLNPSLLYTHRFPLDVLPRALNAMSGREGDFLKAIVTYD